MLVATRDHEPYAGPHHLAPGAPPRTMAARFTSGVQLLGSLIGIPLALIGGYSTYHANFSPEAKCQALRGNIISMLDRKADASTLRLLVHRDVVSFERDCGAVDAEAAAAFKSVLAAEKTPVTKTEHAERAAKPRKLETIAKAEPAPKLHESAPPKREAELDAAWLDSVRAALRDTASPVPAAAELTAPKLAAPMPAPIVVPAEPQLAAKATSRAPDHPVPPAPIPDAN
jgi:hypothetical protein